MSSQGTLVVVDDTAETLSLLFRVLTQAGYQVRPSDSGELALAAVAASPPELILLDIRMPGLDGFEVCRRLKANEASRDIPVLFLSALGETAERVEGLRLGAVDFITKPFQAEELLARVRTHLEIRRLRARLQARVEGQEEDLRRVNTQLRKELAERERAETEKERLEAQYRQLQKADGLRRMAGGVAHHFNNRLHSVILNLDLARRALPPDTEVADFLTEAYQSTRSAADLSRQMVTYLGRTRCRRELLDLSEACRRSVPALQTAANSPGMLHVDLPVPGPAVEADASQVEQMLVHLVTNAREALGNRAGTIRLSVKQIPASDLPVLNRVPIEWSPHDADYACIEVADTGCGIAAADLDKIFDPFFSSKSQDRGLGLPVVLGIARAHFGAVAVRSQPGQGSLFQVLLPVSSAAQVSPDSQAPSRSNADVPVTLLLVDDDPLVRQSTADVLTHLRYRVLQAGDGVEGLEVFRKHRDQIRCVLCDLTLPRMDGWKTLTAMRQLAPRIPVILTSGYTEAEAMEGNHPQLPQSFLGKPYDVAALLEAVKHALSDGPPPGARQDC